MALLFHIREVPHVNILTKCDLLPNKKVLHQFFDPDVPDLISKLNIESHESYIHLNQAIGGLIEEYSMVSFLPLDITVFCYMLHMVK